MSFGWRLGSAAGVLAVVLFVAGFFGLVPPNPPEFGTASASDIREFVEANRTRLFWHSTLPILGWVLFVWFVGALMQAIRCVDRDSWLAGVVLASGVVVAVLFLGFHGFHSELATADLSGSEDATLLARWAFIDASFGLFGVTTFVRATFVASVSFVMITRRLLSPALGWLGVGVATINGADGFEVFVRLGQPLIDLYLFLAWVALISLVMLFSHPTPSSGGDAVK